MLFSKSALPRYGIAFDGKNYCSIYRQNNNFQVQWFSDESSLLSSIPVNSEIVYAIPHQHIWRKVLFLSEQYPQKDLLPKIIQILKQELPLPLEEVYFDYQTQKLQNGIRLAVFALRSTFNTPFQSQQAIWDCELHCTARALLQLNNQSVKDIELFYFPFNNQFFNFQTDGIHFSPDIPQEKQLTMELADIPNEKKQLYLNALGASLWNGTASI